MGRVVPEEVEERITAEPMVAHLATCRDGRPHAAPLWYRYEDDQIEIVTTGTKLRNVRANPRVMVSIERSGRGLPEWVVTLRGTATVVEDEAQSREANRRINEKYGVRDEAWSDNVLVRIDVASVDWRTYD